MSKETRLNIRITPEFQKELKAIAAYYGLTVSSYVHSTLVRKLREEREETPEAFPSAATARENGKIVGMISPGERSPTKEDVRRDYLRAEETMVGDRANVSRLNERKLDLNAEERAERDDNKVSTPRKRVGRR